MDPNNNLSDNCCSCEKWKGEEIAFDTGEDIHDIMCQFGMCDECRADEQFDNDRA